MINLSHKISGVDENNDMGAWVHTLEITIMAVIEAVHNGGRIVKTRMPIVLADGRPLIEETVFFHCQYQLEGLFLQGKVLPGTVGDIRIPVYFDDMCMRKTFYNLFGNRIVYGILLYIDMGEGVIHPRLF